MSNPISVEKIIESIEALSSKDQALLFDQLDQRRKIEQHQDNINQTAKTTEPLQTGNAICNIRATEESNFWGDRTQATYHVLIKNEADGTISATLLGWEGCKAFGRTRSEAVQKLDNLVNTQLAQAEIVSVQLRSTQSDNPWIRLAGKYSDDPLFDDFLADIEAYRREVDAETESSERELDAEVQTTNE